MNRFPSASFLHVLLGTCALTAPAFTLTAPAWTQTAAQRLAATDSAGGTSPPQVVLRLRSAAEFVSAARFPAVPPMPPMLAEERFDPDFLGLQKDEQFETVDLDALQYLLHEGLVARGSMDDSTLGRFGSLVVFQGSPAAVESFDSTFEALRGSLASRIRVRARLLDLGELPGTEERLADRLERADVVWEGQAVGPAGRPLALGLGEHVRYVRQYDVEVAQKMHIGVPTTHEFFEGVSLVVVPHVLAGSEDLVLLTQAVSSRQAGSMQVRSTGISGAPTFDVPTVEVLAFTSSARIGNGAATVVGVSGLASEGRSMALVLEAERLQRAASADGLAVLPLSALRASGLEEGYVSTSETGDGTPVAALAPTAVSAIGATTAAVRLDNSDVEGFVRLALQDWLDAETVSIGSVAGHLVVFGEAQACQRARQVVGELEDTLIRNGELQVRLPLQQAAADSASSALQRVTLPCLRGRTHTVVRGMETLDLTSYYVHIAQEAALMGPRVHPVFRGLLASAQLRDGIDGVDGAVEIQVLETGALRRRPSESQFGESLDMRATQSVSYSHDGPIGGAALRLGVGPVIQRGGREWQSRVEITAK